MRARAHANTHVCIGIRAGECLLTVCVRESACEMEYGCDREIKVCGMCGCMCDSSLSGMYVWRHVCDRCVWLYLVLQGGSVCNGHTYMKD